MSDCLLILSRIIAEFIYLYPLDSLTPHPATHNLITTLFGIRYPIIQAGMIWVSGWRLASAVSNAGGLGLIGAGSMYPETLREHIQKCKAATGKPFGVNVPLLYPEIDKIMAIIVDEGVKIVFTSAGNPTTWTTFLKGNGITVVHVVSNVKFALKAEEAGVDALVTEGFEAGGHNGREETTTMVLIPLIKGAVKIPVIAAGGIASGRSMLAAIALGADGVQVGTRFALTHESSAHQKYKEACITSTDGATVLTLKQLTPVRLIKNKFYEEVKALEEQNGSKEQLEQLLGKGRAKLGIFEGDLDEGELEIGQATAQIRHIVYTKEVIEEMVKEYNESVQKIQSI